MTCKGSAIGSGLLIGMPRFSGESYPPKYQRLTRIIQKYGFCSAVTLAMRDNPSYYEASRLEPSMEARSLNPSSPLALTIGAHHWHSAPRR